ncbi:MAG: hypothetical protein KBT27_04390, partial [Prevotellaceae bacterium]|nr:hypothetical protein [Candidatus Faecinaster equi]
ITKWRLRRFVLASLNLVNSQKIQDIAALDVHGICILSYTLFIRVRASISAWASVLLFRFEGNTRAETSGTASLQSRFYF